MNHYLDIRILPDPEFAAPLLFNALYAKLHRTLAEQQRSDIGASFPGYALAHRNAEGKAQPPSLGTQLRLHGSDAALEALMASNWLHGMRDHLALGTIQPVPPGASYLRVQRKQARSSPTRERDRLMRRKGISEAEARQRIPDHRAQRLDLPYLTLNSQSTGQRFCLFITQHAAPQAASGIFNSYGLSPTATLPAF
ncbi:type I-F CRISPR-associated endoribonuclease Cas6/Csy4 [Leeia aquatica]|uniref:Type I-F CRISPR-associated endoribonuclease Cas6/Csy4 n=1 Tax=Leeia aquatica TaxID=2725557 RepID=A0A847SII8_9NEIS|nr:type I-F CRISPR-associated endoribonuclease Cas6/Csy4 [Leeia aquatica]NLR76969.1 type I-F CRISPR-associated endoribonuclease Cas6/Csy4 [Leeia aquatica]